jgi:predicted nucleic acid-binding protein
MEMIKLLDTNIILYYLGGQLLEPLPKGDYFASVITEIELLAYPKLKKKAENQIKNFLSELTVVDLKPEIKKLTIELKRKFSIKLPDAIIAATALTLNAELLSNDNGFKQLPKLHCRQLQLK